ncbi:hypothetical protein DEJ53_08900 [Weissella confusa]|uniref:hypothetical protein n=1 Tax=Weissella confusa TaxID=1583 RepID=UPI000DCA3BD3|nr:hypothetical protein [Weissella confusa]RAU05457.1 hypothetical protein DEJ53_08900 [Weissella confusa]
MGSVVSVAVALLVSFSINGLYVLYSVMHEALESNFCILLKELKSGLILGLANGLVLMLYSSLCTPTNAIVDLLALIFLFVVIFIVGKVFC